MFRKNEKTMKNNLNDINRETLDKITAELRTIRRLLVALLVGVVVLIGSLINPEISVSLAIVGLFLWLLVVIAGAALNQAQRKRHEAMRFQELSGRTISANRTHAERAAP